MRDVVGPFGEQGGSQPKPAPDRRPTSCLQTPDCGASMLTGRPRGDRKPSARRVDLGRTPITGDDGESHAVPDALDSGLRRALGGSHPSGTLHRAGAVNNDHFSSPGCCPCAALRRRGRGHREDRVDLCTPVGQELVLERLDGVGHAHSPLWTTPARDGGGTSATRAHTSIRTTATVMLSWPPASTANLVRLRASASIGLGSPAACSAWARTVAVSSSESGR